LEAWILAKLCKADPDLSRTVIVNITKFDTKIPQLELRPMWKISCVPPFWTGSLTKLGGPFFTSVPSGRGGTARHGIEISGDYSYDTDQDLWIRVGENADKAVLFRD
jgi:hypothetical protein